MPHTVPTLDQPEQVPHAAQIPDRLKPAVCPGPTRVGILCTLHPRPCTQVWSGAHHVGQFETIGQHQGGPDDGVLWDKSCPRRCIFDTCALDIRTHRSMIWYSSCYISMYFYVIYIIRSVIQYLLSQHEDLNGLWIRPNRPLPVLYVTKTSSNISGS